MGTQSNLLQRIVAVGLAALWLALPLLSVAHGDHAHRYCPEHAAFEEAAGQPDPASVPSPEGDSRATVTSALSGIGDAHQECPLFAAWPRDAQGAPAHLSATALAGWVPALCLSPQTWGAQLPLLSLSPKASPPLA